MKHFPELFMSSPVRGNTSPLPNPPELPVWLTSCGLRFHCLTSLLCWAAPASSLFKLSSLRRGRCCRDAPHVSLVTLKADCVLPCKASSSRELPWQAASCEHCHCAIQMEGIVPESSEFSPLFPLCVEDRGYLWLISISKRCSGMWLSSTMNQVHAWQRMPENQCVI